MVVGEEIVRHCLAGAEHQGEEHHDKNQIRLRQWSIRPETLRCGAAGSGKQSHRGAGRSVAQYPGDLGHAGMRAAMRT